MAAKKSFKGANPAMQFISAAVEESSIPAPPRVEPPRVEHSRVEHTRVEHPRVEPPPLEVVPKNEPQTTAAVPAEERKTKRLNLLVQPSVLQDATKIAHMQQTSVNDLINTVLKSYCGEQVNLIARYNEVFGK